MFRLARYLKYFKKEIIIGPFFKLLEAIFELIVPLVMASVIDIGIKTGDKIYVLQRGGIILILGAIGLIFALICQYSAARASQGVGTKVRNDLFAHINTLSHGELDQLGTNSLITVITNDVNQIQLAVAMLIRLVVRAPFLVIGATAMAMVLDLKLSLIFLAVAPIVSLLLFIIMKKSIPFYRIRQKVLDKISLITRENLTGARVIRAFSRQEKEERRFEDANEEVAEIATRVGKLSAILSPATFTVMNIAVIAIIWFGGMRVDAGSLTQGEIIALVNYLTQISIALVVVANLVIIFTKASASAARINKIFDTKSSLTEGVYQEDIGEISNSSSIEDNFSNLSNREMEYDKLNSVPQFSLRQVSFAYPGSEENALEDINVDIMKGEMIGIIGGTGSGKSTLVNLLPRLYDVTKGEVLMNGIPLKNYSFESLRKQFGIAPQKSVLFYGSIADNLRVAKVDATEEEFTKAIEIAQAKEFVEQMPDQYETMIMQGGKNLSGGQRQRLTIARALVGSPKVLILDDSVSALDFATDAKLRIALRENCKGMTIFIVSQRAGSIKHADKIIVMDEGRMVGVGKHNELLQCCEVYKEICLSQLSSEEVNRR
ncbi:MAG: ABC transporter ATP-binding protein [Mobilitalea sp.]